jgi:thiol-disulfide isomerase/thioredoxin
MNDTSSVGEHAPLPAHSHAPGLGKQARWLMGGIAVLALAALFWPHGTREFEAPGGFLIDGGGRPQPLAPRMAPVTLVHFWASWCPPCVGEVPALKRLIADFAGRSDFAVVMIAVDDSKEKVETFVGGRAPGMLYDPKWDVAHRYGTDQIPESYLVVSGRVVHKWDGAVDWDDAKVRDRLTRALAALHAPKPAAGG